MRAQYVTQNCQLMYVRPFQIEALLQGITWLKSEQVGRLETENETSCDHIWPLSLLTTNHNWPDHIFCGHVFILPWPNNNINTQLKAFYTPASELHRLWSCGKIIKSRALSCCNKTSIWNSLSWRQKTTSTGKINLPSKYCVHKQWRVQLTHLQKAMNFEVGLWKLCTCIYMHVYKGIFFIPHESSMEVATWK